MWIFISPIVLICWCDSFLFRFLLLLFRCIGWFLGVCWLYSNDILWQFLVVFLAGFPALVSRLYIPGWRFLLEAELIDDDGSDGNKDGSAAYNYYHENHVRPETCNGAQDVVQKCAAGLKFNCISNICVTSLLNMYEWNSHRLCHTN